VSLSAHDDWDELVKRALADDDAAWRTIVDRLAGVVWKVLNLYSLDRADREDAFASTFLRLYQRLDTVRDPEKLPGWVATTARREANAIWRAQQRMVVMAELPLAELTADTVAEPVLEGELLQMVLRAFELLPADGQALLRLLTAVPPLSYADIAELLDMPRGSIGPKGGRLLAQLRRMLSSYTSGDTR
jgi:RNA polymerase sigma factor (sigma-70 family)